MGNARFAREERPALVRVRRHRPYHSILHLAFSPVAGPLS